MAALSLLFCILVVVLSVLIALFSIPVLLVVGILCLAGILSLLRGLLSIPFRLMNLLPAALTLGLALLLL